MGVLSGCLAVSLRMSPDALFSSGCLVQPSAGCWDTRDVEKALVETVEVSVVVEGLAVLVLGLVVEVVVGNKLVFLGARPMSGEPGCTFFLMSLSRSLSFVCMCSFVSRWSTGLGLLFTDSGFWGDGPCFFVSPFTAINSSFSSFIFLAVGSFFCTVS